MKLFILRHGEAGTASTDRVRPLTSTGREQVRQVAVTRYPELSALDVIMTSPLRRARETGAVVARSLSYTGELVVSDALAPEANLTGVSQLLNAMDGQSVLIVSHQPLVGYLLAWLTGQNQLPWMDTGCLAHVDLSACAANSGELLWVERPHL